MSMGCVQSHVLPSAFKTVCPLLKHCGGAFLLHTGVSQDGVASGWRFSRWRRFRISMKSQHQGRRAEGRSVSAMCQTHRSSGLLRSSRSTPTASIATLQHVSECDFGKFIVATDGAIWRKVDSLSRQSCRTRSTACNRGKRRRSIYRNWVHISKGGDLV